ncbi:hypothetical protein Pmar_PMAR005908, partial [Perkinsus marinus ATCC 50983]
DASEWIAAYELRQNGDLYDEGSMVFPRSKADIAISVKKLQAVYMGLAAVYELEIAASKKFISIHVQTDNTTVATILRTRRVVGTAKREPCPILTKYLSLIQELYPPSDWSRLPAEVVATERNSADRLTKHPYFVKLLSYRDHLQRASERDTLKEYDKEPVVSTNVAKGASEWYFTIDGHICDSCYSDLPLVLKFDTADVAEAQEENEDI